MGLETINSNSKPDALREDWPLSSDNPREGDDHIRNIKIAMKNFYSAYETYKQTITARWDGEKARNAKQADKLGDKDLAYILDLDNATGTLPGASLQAASLTQAGVVQLSSSLTDVSEDKAATPKAVNALKKVIEGADAASDAVTWNKVATSGRSTNFPSDLIATLTGKSNVELVITARAATNNGRLYITFTPVISWADWTNGGTMQALESPQGSAPSAPAWIIHLNNTSGIANRFLLELKHKTVPRQGQPAITTNYEITQFAWRKMFDKV